MKLLLIICLFALASCGNKHKTITTKKFHGCCICAFEYENIGAGGVYFEDSCHFYQIGDTIQ